MTWLIFPNQLFKQFLALSKSTPLLIVEEPLFFCDSARSTRFGKVKLAYTKATLLAFQAELKAAGFTAVELIPYAELANSSLKACLQSRRIERIQVYDPTDHLLMSRLLELPHTLHTTPAFLYTPSELAAYQEAMRGKNCFHQTAFYRHFRQLRGWLMTKGGGYEGGQLTYDQDNRKPMPASTFIPEPFSPNVKEDEPYWREACAWVEEHFPKHPGDLSRIQKWGWPVTRQSAQIAWDRFLTERYRQFGPYQDAMRSGWEKDGKHATLFHSTISAALNSGLLDPADLASQCLSPPSPVPLASREGFLRQLVGWREFIRFVYGERGEEMRQANQLNAQLELSPSWYSLQPALGIPPLDEAIAMAWSLGYLHHILRLMVVANWQTILGVHPMAMYRWFLETTMDSYDWVMVPNVMGMASYASPLLSTKPYISGSAYLLRMSNYGRGAWCQDWDALYYDFLQRNETILAKNPRCGLMYANLRKKKPTDLKALLDRAKQIKQGDDRDGKKSGKRYKESKEAD